MRSGPIMAATDNFDIVIEGVGGHAARPQFAVDPIVVGAQIVSELQSIVSRNVDPLDNAVLSVTMVEAGEADNVISRSAKITGTVRTLDGAVQDLIEARLGHPVEIAFLDRIDIDRELLGKLGKMVEALLVGGRVLLARVDQDGERVFEHIARLGPFPCPFAVLI